jgi:hypothetical protein
MNSKCSLLLSRKGKYIVGLESFSNGFTVAVMGKEISRRYQGDSAATPSVLVGSCCRTSLLQCCGVSG